MRTCLLTYLALLGINNMYPYLLIFFHEYHRITNDRNISCHTDSETVNNKRENQRCKNQNEYHSITNDKNIGCHTDSETVNSKRENQR